MLSGGGELENDDVIVATQTVAQLSAVGTNAQPFALVTARQTATKHTRWGFLRPVTGFSSCLPPAAKSTNNEREGLRGGQVQG